ncbi:hypothetical protein OG874_06895 [Nocardia sp. NBC_00565]|uniref:hypothetical protein n=1 Tax=Nocardia sp. NBC_00565 TaxID=2975993 RepID=UPI002E7FE075|nr:hypothetical protein [Nocardia sp. NBC_00565]WUC04878.1 hypothetical protein OG874_06895 [Nocardia sp. NBC_00565]
MLNVATDTMNLAERRQAIRRLVAICHVVNRLVELAETESSEPLIAQAHTTRRVLQDLVLDMVATDRH